MKIEKKSYYFIKDKFFKFADDKHLLLNKENNHSRPCFLIAQEKGKIFWLVPISSKIEKYKKLFLKKKKNMDFATLLSLERC